MTMCIQTIHVMNLFLALKMSNETVYSINKHAITLINPNISTSLFVSFENPFPSFQSLDRVTKLLHAIHYLFIYLFAVIIRKEYYVIESFLTRKAQKAKVNEKKNKQICITTTNNCIS